METTTVVLAQPNGTSKKNPGGSETLKKKKSRRERRNTKLGGEDVLTYSKILTAEQVQFFRLPFDTADEDKTGTLDQKEFKKLIESLGLGLATGEIEQMMNELDGDHDGVISFDEYLGMMAKKMTNSSCSDNDLLSAFQAFDVDKKGYITDKEFRNAMALLPPEQFSPAEVNELLQLCDVNNDGRIEYTEWVKFLQSNHTRSNNGESRVQVDADPPDPGENSNELKLEDVK
eukprot:g1363.t1